MSENEAEKILRWSEEWLRLAVQAGKMYAFEWDATTDVLVRSPEYVNVLAATEPRTLTQQQVLERVHPDDRPNLLAAIARHSPENPTVEATYRVLLPGKPPVWVRSSGRAFFDGEGRMLRVIGMVADVTDQKLAEQALRVSEERRRLAEQAARIGTFERDVRTGCITWADGLEPLYGLSPGSLDGKTPEFIRDLIHPSDRQSVAQLVEQALKTRQPTEGEWRAIWPDGSVHWIAGRWQVLMDESGQPLRVVGANLDITDRKNHEEALRVSEARLRLAQQATHIGTFERDLRTGVTWAAELEPLYGLPPSSLDGTTIAFASFKDLIHPDDWDGFQHLTQQSLKTGQPTEGEWRAIWPDGSAHWIGARWQVLMDESGQPSRILGVNINITERKRAEEALSDMTRKLVEALEQERARIARELHDDINQRLALLAIELDLVQGESNDLPSKVRGHIQELQQLTTDISSRVYALSHDLHSLTPDSLELEKGIRSWCREFGRRQKMEIDFKGHDMPRLPQEITICLFRVLQEALHNAAKHSGVKRVDVQLREESGEIQLTVSDLGKGFDIAAATRDRGLGITSMQERVRLVGGTISIDSEPLAGTVVHVCVPFRQNARVRRNR